MLAVEDARHSLEMFKVQYEALVLEDKAMDRNFKKEFGDISNTQYEQLYKLFKKRPRFI